jgi:cytochrome c553
MVLAFRDRASNHGVCNMGNIRFPTILGALVISATALSGPAKAADGIEEKVQVCNSCHGQNGVPSDPKTIPIIWGQQTSFLVKQLHDYRAGDRDNPVMKAMAQTLKQEELRPAAVYFASKSWPAGHAAAPAASPPNGIAQCVACHQEKFAGGMPAPRLAGQTYEYLIKQMSSFADGTRSNNADMVTIMKALSAADREAMARYIASL